MTSSRVHSLRDWRSYRSEKGRYIYMLENHVGCDISFSVGEGDAKGTVHAHKFILISRSSVFEEMFSGEKSPQTIEVSETPVESFKTFLRFLYTGENHVTSGNILHIHYLARKFRVQELAHACATWLLRTINHGNVCTILEHARQYGEEFLLQKCLNFVFSHGRQILLSTKFDELSQQSVALVLKSDYLAVSENVVYEAILRWSTHQCRVRKLEPTGLNKRDVCGTLINLIRFPIMDPRYFSSKVSTDDILNESEKVEIFQYIASSSGARPIPKGFIAKNRMTNFSFA
ncbi:hypothetical protein ACJMK2_017868 [Sinanodonta woodiana]|uniref:BTB domain-containing protein n=1 Tax=Sinanodonta woodiana TaxID=1069815 RepID=A0ABD3UD54_SINWO